MTPEELELQQINRELELRQINEVLAHRKEESPQKAKPSFGEIITESLKEAPRPAARALRNIATSAGHVIDLPFLPAELARYGVQSLRGKNPKFGKWLPNTAEKIKHGIDVATRDYAKPRTEGEELADVVGESVGSLLTGTGIAGGASKIPAFMKIGTKMGEMFAPTAMNIGAAVGAPLAAEGYHRTTPDAGPLGTLLAGAAGALGGGYGAVKGPGIARALTQSPKTTAAKIAGNLFDVQPELYAKWKEAGVPVSIANVSDRKIAQQLESIMSQQPSTEKYLTNLYKKRREKILGGLGVEEEDLSKAISESRHRLAREGAHQHKTAKSAEYEEALGSAKGLQEELKNEQVTLGARDLLSQLENDYHINTMTEAAKARFRKTFEGQIYEDILKDSALPITEQKDAIKALRQKGYPEYLVKQYANKLSVAEDPHITFQTLEELKDRALTRSQDRSLPPNEQRKANTLHDMLREKAEKVLETHATPEQLPGIKEAKRLWAEYASPTQSNMREHVYDLLGYDTPTAAFNSLTRPGKKYLEAASKYLDPRQKQDLAESLMATAGKKDNYLNPVKALTTFEKWAPHVQKDFLNLLKGEKQREAFLNLKDLVLNNKARFEDITNTSRTMHMTAVGTTLKELAKIAKNTTKWAATGTTAYFLGGPAAAASLVAGVLAAKGGAKLWTNPLFLERINQVMLAKKPAIMGRRLDLLLRTPSVKSLLNQKEDTQRPE